MERAHYDCWLQLLALCRPTEPSGEWATITPTEKPTVCLLTWPDKSYATLVFKDGEWWFHESD